jgi:hypothetical protein
VRLHSSVFRREPITTDPRGFYDWANGRYIFVMLTESSFTSNNVGQIMVAVSKKNNPTGGWSIIKLQVGATGECPDYPTMGHDSNNWGKNGTKGAMMSDIEICRHSTVHGVYHRQHVWTLEFKSETRVANRGFAGIRIFLADCGRLSVLHRPRLHGLVVLV